MADTTAKRVHSIDALRGLDMLFIVGADQLLRAVAARTEHPWLDEVARQLEHADWHGFRAYDLIFPLFLFLVGAVLPFSLEKYRGGKAGAAVYWRILRRGVLLVALGLVCNRVLDFDFERLRYVGVLQRIGVCYVAGALLYLWLPLAGRATVVGVLLVGYWLLMSFVGAEGVPAGSLEKHANLAGWLDRMLLPGRIPELYYGYGDNEGLLSTLPAVATTLLGSLAGTLLRGPKGGWAKVAWLLLAGAGCLFLGHLWSVQLPINKILWTSSFVLWTAGWSLLLLAAFYAVIDVVGFRWWALPLEVVGANAILIYVFPRIFDFAKASQFLLAGAASLTETWGPVILIAGMLALKWLFLWVLYRQKLFLRV